MDKWLAKQVEAKALQRIQDLVFARCPSEIADFWNGYWRRRAEEGFFDDVWAEGEF